MSEIDVYGRRVYDYQRALRIGAIPPLEQVLDPSCFITDEDVQGRIGPSLEFKILAAGVAAACLTVGAMQHRASKVFASEDDSGLYRPKAVLLGDSLLEGQGDTFVEALEEQGLDVTGIFSAVSAELSPQATDLISKHHGLITEADVVLLSYGTNDSVGEVQQDLEAVVTDILDIGAQDGKHPLVVVPTIFSTAPHVESVQKNAFIETVDGMRYGGIPSVRVYQRDDVLRDHGVLDMLYDDGVHLTQAGYDAMSRLDAVRVSGLTDRFLSSRDAAGVESVKPGKPQDEQIAGPQTGSNGSNSTTGTGIVSGGVIRVSSVLDAVGTVPIGSGTPPMLVELDTSNTSPVIVSTSNTPGNQLIVDSNRLVQSAPVLNVSAVSELQITDRPTISITPVEQVTPSSPTITPEVSSGVGELTAEQIRIAKDHGIFYDESGEARQYVGLFHDPNEVSPLIMTSGFADGRKNESGVYYEQGNIDWSTGGIQAKILAPFIGIVETSPTAGQGELVVVRGDINPETGEHYRFYATHVGQYTAQPGDLVLPGQQIAVQGTSGYTINGIHFSTGMYSQGPLADIVSYINAAEAGNEHILNFSPKINEIMQVRADARDEPQEIYHPTVDNFISMPVIEQGLQKLGLPKFIDQPGAVSSAPALGAQSGTRIISTQKPVSVAPIIETVEAGKDDLTARPVAAVIPIEEPPVTVTTEDDGVIVPVEGVSPEETPTVIPENTVIGEEQGPQNPPEEVIVQPEEAAPGSTENSENTPNNTVSTPESQDPPPAAEPQSHIEVIVPLADYVAAYESQGSYDAMNTGTSGSGTLSAEDSENRLGLGKPLSEMTFAEVKQAQAAGNLFAAGKYQYITETLPGVQADAGIPDDALFNAANQERLFITSLKFSRPAVWAYLNGDQSVTSWVALNELSKEWASIPSPEKGGRSYYDGVGDNAAGHNAQQEPDEALRQGYVLLEMMRAAVMEYNNASG